MTNTSEPAYPVIGDVHHSHFGWRTVQFNDMTKREAFAMAAMQGLIANSVWTADSRIAEVGKAAEISVAFADALLAELAKAQP